MKLGEKSFADGMLVRRFSASLSLARQEARTHTNELIVTIPMNVTIYNLNLPSNELSSCVLPARATFARPFRLQLKIAKEMPLLPCNDSGDQGILKGHEMQASSVDIHSAQWLQ